MNNIDTNLPLFSFGTLMDADLLTLVSGQPQSELSLESARLTGFVQREVQGDNFPVLVSEAGASTNGCVIRGLTSIGLQRILFFEGEEYALSPITIERSEGELLQCVYFKDTAVYLVKDTHWDFKLWHLREKTEFLKRTRHYMSFFGKLSAADADEHW